MKSYTDINQSRKLAEILPIESADCFWDYDEMQKFHRISWFEDGFNKESQLMLNENNVCAWSLGALFNILPEINGIPLKVEKVKAEDGYDGYYYHIEYEGIVLIPYSKNPIDACVAMIEKLHELNLL